MPVINFPSNPSNNELFIAQGKSMRYNAAKNKWKQVGTLTAAQVTEIENKSIGVSSMSISGNTLVIQKDDSTHANVSLASFAGNILTNYASASQLPITNLVSGTQVYVTDTDSLFITDGSGWFKVATVNLSPSFSLGVSSINLSPSGTIDVNYTINEPEDTPYTISASATANATITVHQSNNTLSIVGGSNATSETITVSATDGVNTVGDTMTMVITLPSWADSTQTSRIEGPSGINESARFGFRFATANKDNFMNGAQLIIGATSATGTDGNANSGRLYKYEQATGGTTWTHTHTFESWDEYANGRLGHQVACGASGAYFAGGAPYSPNGSATTAGAVYTFTNGNSVKNGATEGHRDKISHPYPSSGDKFGVCIRMAYENRNDPHLFVGSGNNSAKDENGSVIHSGSVSKNRGAVHYYEGTSGTFTLRKVLTPSDIYNNSYGTDSGGSFGESIASDSTGEHLVVGANTKKVNGNNMTGAIYIYRRNNHTSWTERQIINGANQMDRLGFGVAMSHDGKYIAASSGESLNANYGGENEFGFVKIYYNPNPSSNLNTWSLQATLQATVEGHDGFGFGNQSVAFNRNADVIVIGANGHGGQDMTQPNAGGAFYVFTRSGTSWTQTALKKRDNQDASHSYFFGMAVGIVEGGINDGLDSTNYDTIVAGAENDKTGGTSGTTTGNMYAFNIPGAP